MPFTEAERRLIAAGWSSASCDQATYAAEHGISARALRKWVERYGAGSRPEAKARAIVERAIRELEDLRAALGAEAAGRSGSSADRREDGVPERHAEEEPKVTGAARQPLAGPKPMPAAGYFAGI